VVDLTWPLFSHHCCSIVPLHRRLVYACGEVIDMTGSTVVNNSKFPQPAQVVLRCFVELTGGYGVHTAFHHDQVLYETVIPEHSTVVITNNADFNQIRIPAVPPTWSGEYLDQSQTQRCQACIKWTYTLEIRLTEWGSGFHCRTPILISATPPFTHKLQDLRHEQGNPVFLDHWSINQQAVFGPKENEMAPTLTRFNNRGRPKFIQRDEPIWIRDECERDDWMSQNGKMLREWTEEGKWNPVLDQYFYRPVTNFYTGPSIQETKESPSGSARSSVTQPSSTWSSTLDDE
jgi:hypothetical protein